MSRISPVARRRIRASLAGGKISPATSGSRPRAASESVQVARHNLSARHNAQNQYFRYKRQFFRERHSSSRLPRFAQPRGFRSPPESSPRTPSEGWAARGARDEGRGARVGGPVSRLQPACSPQARGFSPQSGKLRATRHPPPRGRAVLGTPSGPPTASAAHFGRPYKSSSAHSLSRRCGETGHDVPSSCAKSETRNSSSIQR